MISYCVWKFIPLLGFRTNASSNELAFIHLYLTKETLSHFEVRTARVKELKCFHDAPSELSHDISRYHKTSPILSLHWLNQNTLMIFNSFIYEFINFIRYFFSLVKQGLFFVVLPVESEVLNSNSLPKIAQLSACRVYNPCNFVCYNELEILKQKSVFDSNKT